MEAGKISIIVPVYKVEKYLRKCVESIINQTYKNIEVILVDDGSPDQCGEICDNYAKIDNRIKVIHKENGGLSSARNAGLSICSGDYLLFIDSDDWISPRLCENTIQDFRISGADVVVYGYSRIDENNRVLENCVALEPREIMPKEGVGLLLTSSMENYAWNKIYKRSVFSGIKYPEGRLWEDIGTTYKVFLNSKKIYISNRILYYYLVRSGSITSTPHPKSLLDIFAQRKEQYELVLNTWPDIAKKALPNLLVSAIEICDRFGRCEESKEAANFLTNMKGIIRIDNKKIKLFWKNEQLFYLVFAFLNKHRSTVINLKERYSAIKRSIRPLLRKVRLLRNKLRNELHYEKLDDDNRKRFLLIGTPDHDNLGDHAITLASKEFLLQYGNVYSVSELDYWKRRRSLINQVKPDDIVVLQGGGNIGDQYMYIEDIRQDAIKTFKCNKKIVFPQTIYFTDDTKGNLEKKRTKRIYSRAKKLTVFAREKYSYAAMKELFGGITQLVPDIVLSLTPSNNEFSRSGILFCVRSDFETKLLLQERLFLEDTVAVFDGDIHYTDTCIKEYCDEEKAQEKIKEKLTQFKKTKLVVTDRLHGMVFAALTGTPCVTVTNYNKKIEGVYDWISDINNIIFVSDFSNREKLSADIETILHVESNNIEVLSNLQNRFQVLRNQIC